MDFNLTLIGQTIAMIVFVWFCMKYIWPFITGAIEQRQTEIADGLAAAEQGKNSLATAKVEIDKIIAAARDQARGIVEQANTRAASIVDHLEHIVRIIASNRRLWVETMLDLELGLPPEGSSPLRAGLSTFAAFVAVGLVPLVVPLEPPHHGQARQRGRVAASVHHTSANTGSTISSTASRPRKCTRP